jgi:hypothetical protein
VKRVGPGYGVLAGDATGQGHSTRAMDHQPWFYAVVLLAEAEPGPGKRHARDVLAQETGAKEEVPMRVARFRGAAAGGVSTSSQHAGLLAPRVVACA